MRSRATREDAAAAEKYSLVTANSPAHVRARERARTAAMAVVTVLVLVAVIANAGPESLNRVHLHSSAPPIAATVKGVTHHVAPATEAAAPTEATLDGKDDETNGGGATPMQQKYPVLKLCDSSAPTWDDVQALVDADTEPWSPTEIKRHLDAIFLLFSDEAAVACLQKVYKALATGPTGTDASTKVFFDLGSREIDSTTTFLKKYPKASTFVVHCFEANPKFNGLYPPFQRLHPNVIYHNLAVGVTNTTLTLSDRSVGSSVLEKAGGAAAVGGVTVPVVNFADFIARRAGPEVRPGAFGVIKMDIEKMEYAVLHQMLRTGTIAVFREFLLECHYTTNLPKAKRDPAKHIGKDDCYALVEALRKVAPPLAAFPAAKYATGLEVKGAPSAMEVVLWNSPKYAKATGSHYMERHGNFFPT
jgi:FkbM family methyltransferase